MHHSLSVSFASSSSLSFNRLKSFGIFSPLSFSNCFIFCINRHMSFYELPFVPTALCCLRFMKFSGFRFFLPASTHDNGTSSGWDESLKQIRYPLGSFFVYVSILHSLGGVSVFLRFSHLTNEFHARKSFFVHLHFIVRNRASGF